VTPAAEIAKLDRQLAQHGQDVVIRRYTAVSGSPRPKTDVPARAFVRAVKADQLAGKITQTASNVVLSPSATGLAALLPLEADDKIVIAERERNVELAKPIEMAGTLVRIDLVVLG